MIMLKVTKAEANGWRDFMVVQWLRFYTPNARGLGSTPGQGTRPHMLQLKKRKKKKRSLMLQCNPIYLILIYLFNCNEDPVQPNKLIKKKIFNIMGEAV